MMKEKYKVESKGLDKEIIRSLVKICGALDLGSYYLHFNSKGTAPLAEGSLFLYY